MSQILRDLNKLAAKVGAPVVGKNISEQVRALSTFWDGTSHGANIAERVNELAHSHIGEGGTGTLIEKTITSNDTYNAADDNADGYSKVTVNVPSAEPTLITKSIIQNGTYNASSDNADGYISVEVEVPMEPLKLCIIDSSYDWKDYAGYLTPASTTHLIRNEDKFNGTRETQRAAACGSIYVPAGKIAVIYTDVEGMEVAGWRTTEVGYPYNGEPNWGRGWVSTPATIDNSNSAVPYVFVPHFRYSDDRTLTDDNRPQFCFAEIR